MHERQMLAEGTVDELDCETGVHKLVAIFLELFSDVRGEDEKRTVLSDQFGIMGPGDLGRCGKKLLIDGRSCSALSWVAMGIG